MKKNYFIHFTLLAVFILTVDRVTKIFAVQGAHIKNYGLLFGFFTNPDSRWVFAFLALTALFFFIFVLNLTETKKSNTLQLGLILMIAGLVGNLVDRVIYGFVIDFIKFFGISTFNLSDVSILVGSLFVLNYIVKSSKKS